jgi:hypothetical protein
VVYLTLDCPAVRLRDVHAWAWDKHRGRDVDETALCNCFKTGRLNLMVKFAFDDAIVFRASNHDLS